MDFNIDVPGSFHIDLAKVAKNKDFSSLVRLLATDMITTGYVHVGNFIHDMSDSEIETLLDGMDEQEDQQMQEIILISEMLAIGEGCEPSKDTDEFTDRANHLAMLLAIEGLSRKGLVKAYHENFSFHEDSGDKIIVEKLID